MVQHENAFHCRHSTNYERKLVALAAEKVPSVGHRMNVKKSKFKIIYFSFCNWKHLVLLPAAIAARLQVQKHNEFLIRNDGGNATTTRTPTTMKTVASGREGETSDFFAFALTFCTCKIWFKLEWFMFFALQKPSRCYIKIGKVSCHVSCDADETCTH